MTCFTDGEIGEDEEGRWEFCGVTKGLVGRLDGAGGVSAGGRFCGCD